MGKGIYLYISILYLYVWLLWCCRELFLLLQKPFIHIWTWANKRHSAMPFAFTHTQHSDKIENTTGYLCVLCVSHTFAEYNSIDIAHFSLQFNCIGNMHRTAHYIQIDCCRNILHLAITHMHTRHQSTKQTTTTIDRNENNNSSNDDNNDHWNSRALDHRALSI